MLWLYSSVRRRIRAMKVNAIVVAWQNGLVVNGRHHLMENYVHFSISMFLFRLLLDLLKRQSCGSNYCRRIYLMKVGAYVCLSYDRNCFKGFEKYTPAV